MKAAHKLDDPTAEAEADADLHMLIYEASHNIVLLHIMRAFSEMLRQRRVLQPPPALYPSRRARRSAGAASGHRRGDLARDPEKAAEAASAHMRATARTLEEIRQEQTRVARALRRMGRSEFVA